MKYMKLFVKKQLNRMNIYSLKKFILYQMEYLVMQNYNSNAKGVLCLNINVNKFLLIVKRI